MKPPELIKKGLDCCQTIVRCSICPYHDIGNIVAECTAQLSGDALAYIKQLESDNESKQKRIDELESRLAQVERERDAAVRDLGKAMSLDEVEDCSFCKNNKKPYCDPCNWEWRGVCAENTEEGTK